MSCAKKPRLNRPQSPVSSAPTIYIYIYILSTQSSLHAEKHQVREKRHYVSIFRHFVVAGADMLWSWWSPELSALMLLLQSFLWVLEWALLPCVFSSRAGCNLQNGYAKVVLPLTTGIMYHTYCMGTCGTVAHVSLTVHPFNESNDVTKDLLIDVDCWKNDFVHLRTPQSSVKFCNDSQLLNAVFSLFPVHSFNRSHSNLLNRSRIQTIRQWH